MEITREKFKKMFSEIAGHKLSVYTQKDIDKLFDEAEHNGQVLCGSGLVAKETTEYWKVGDTGTIWCPKIHAQLGFENISQRNPTSDCYTTWPQAVAESERRQGIVPKPATSPEALYGLREPKELWKEYGKYRMQENAKVTELKEELADADIRVMWNPSTKEFAKKNGRGTTKNPNQSEWYSKHYKMPALFKDGWVLIPLSEARRIEAERLTKGGTK